MPANPDHVPAFLLHFTRVSADRYAVAALGLATLLVLYTHPRLRNVRRNRYHERHTAETGPSFEYSLLSFVELLTL